MNVLDFLNINPHLEFTLAQQLKQQLAWMIAIGQLKPGDLLPSVRKAAASLNINLHTVRDAYRKLEDDGLVATRQGLGTLVLPYTPGHFSPAAGLVRSYTVGVIVPSISNPFYHQLFQGVEFVASQRHTILFLSLTHDDPSEVGRDYAQMAAKGVDGIILASHDDSPFLTNEPGSAAKPGGSLPLVSVDWPDSQGYTVVLDTEKVGTLATRHLIEHGHHRIGLITYTLDISNVAPINYGYQQALTAAGIELDTDLVIRVHGFDITAGKEGAQKLLSLPRLPTAIFAITDLMAIGAIGAVKAAGLRVPEDIAIIGFNDIPLATLVEPPLTTVAAPSYQVGLKAMEMLQTIIDGKQPAQKKIVAATTLVIRRSCGCQGDAA